MTAVDGEDTCPFCGEVNTCMAKSTQLCWCIAATIPVGLVELVPPPAKGKACICQACVRRYNQDPASFRSRCAAE
ncbi:cysteine-rich CWC family protein [Haliea sp. E1-2-M8]|uniref:cysteine-rich CWC family protein n=1 Tax=Haliea sp. E1-2-M8 TaxID=3064706 RepID=UPI00351C815A